MPRNSNFLSMSVVVLGIVSADMAAAQQHPQTEQPSAPQTAPTAPPVAPVLPMLSPQDLAKLRRTEANTFIYQVEKQNADALVGLCQTGFGDPTLCFKPQTQKAPEPTPPPTPPKPAEATSHPRESVELPVVTALSGFDDDLHATVAYATGRSQAIRVGSVLAGGETVERISVKEVTVKRTDGKVVPLYFTAPIPTAEVR